MIKNLSDYHVHPDYSLDATGSVDQYCQKALKIGLKRICLTTHYDADPVRKDFDFLMKVESKTVPVTPEIVNRYIDEIRKAGQKYSESGLDVLAGLEVDYAPHIEETLRKDLPQFDLDYLLGAVHCLDHIAITSSVEAEKYFKRNNMYEMCEEYYDVLTQAASSGLFHCIAHLDCYRKYGLSFYGEEIYTAHRDFMQPALKALTLNDVGIEINTSARRQGQKDFYPSREILELAKASGVRVVAIGSDAHKLDDLGKDLEEAYELTLEFFPESKTELLK
ncbi:MAG: histidinol-phosphatase [Candidatus Zixiibacteriota bacterium]